MVYKSVADADDRYCNNRTTSLEISSQINSSCYLPYAFCLVYSYLPLSVLQTRIFVFSIHAYNQFHISKGKAILELKQFKRHTMKSDGRVET
jgi:hypothetical protein